MKSSKKGFTLIELIVVIAIMGTVFTTIYSVLDSGNKLYNNGMKTENIETNGRLCILSISQEIKNSKCYSDTSSMSDSQFSTLVYNSAKGAIKKIAYIEDYNNNRFMYILVPSDNGYTLHQLKFSNQGRYRYAIAAPMISQNLSDTDISSIDDKDKVSYVNGDMSSSELSKLPGGYSPNYFIYENYGEQCYLCATNGTDNIKVNLERIPNEDLKDPKDTVIADYVNDISLTKEDALGRTCKLFVDVKDKEKEKTITTNVFLLNGNNSEQ